MGQEGLQENNTHSISQDPAETQNQEDIWTYKRGDLLQELVHLVMEAEKSHSLPPAC